MSAPDIIVVMRGPGETRLALLAGDDVVEIVHRRDGVPAAGAAVLGRVVGHAPGFAFVDIGDAQPGVLKAKSPLMEGSKLVVRIVVPARADKGAELARADREAPAPDPAAVWWQRHRETIADIHAAPAAELWRLKAALPDAPLRDGGADPFARFGVDAAIEAALDPVILLPDGARLIVAPTAAAITIDIDAGPAHSAAANAAAVPAIAQALRLRNLAGHILIDVIPGARGAARAFADRLKAAVADDPVAVQIAGVTPLGMVELTRRREGLMLAETLGDAVAEAAYAALRRAVRVAMEARVAGVVISGGAEVIARLQGPLRPAVDEAAEQAKCTITFAAKSAWPGGRAEVNPV